MNGRFVVHCVVQFFAGIAGKQCFNVCNAVVFACLLYLICISIGLTLKSKVWLWAIIISLFWWLAPQPTLLDGFQINRSLNYLWVATALLLFLLLFQRGNNNDNVLKLLLLFIFSMLCGNLQEAFTIGVEAYVMLELWLRRKQGWSKRQVVMAIGFLIGLAFLVFSPGSWRRIHEQSGGGSQLLLRVKMFIIGLSAYTTLYLLILTIIVCSFVDRIRLIELVKKYRAFLVIVVVQFGVVLFVNGSFVNKRSMFAVDFFSLMFVLAVIKHYICQEFIHEQLLKGLGIACTCSLFILNTGIIYSSYLSEKAFQQALQTAIDGDGNACLSYSLNPYYSRYVANCFEDYTWELKREAIRHNKRIRMCLFDDSPQSRDEQ